MNNTISNPNVYLFYFYLQKQIKNEHQIWQKGNEILLNCKHKIDDFDTNIKDDKGFEYTQINSLLDFKEKPSNIPVDLVQSNCLEPKVDRVTFKGKFTDKITNNQLSIDGFVYPLQIHDSYCLCFNLGCPDEPAQNIEDINLLEKFKIAKSLKLEDDDNFLGETLLITAHLPDKLTEKYRDENEIKHDIRTLADKCCNILLKPESTSPFHHAGELFGSPIFEYGLINREIDIYPHVIVWLFKDKEADKKFEIYEREIIDLFLYRHKLIKAFQDSYKVYKKLEKQYQQIQNYIDDFENKSNNHLVEDDLNNFQNKLKELPKKALEYTRWLNVLQDYQNTIVLNTHNYNEKLEQIRSTEIETNLRFLETFSKKNCLTFLEQIKGDLNYFVPSARLFDNTIAAIRALVAIEQARIEKEKLNVEEKVQNTIESVGVGIGVGFGVGGLFSSNYSLIEKPWQLPSSKHPFLPPHPFVAAFSSSLVLGVGLGLLSWWCTKSYLDKKRLKNN
ncbi:hypothetical protein [Brunnivagina elsteri]|uniref:Uncharacterized protein n=1 Tax=Brunnivagina elsteri CCALA 953 TaxID=987040 RepID=A0A2A2TNE5_9CYAN|nr:hypothetical protein [Calothrix elsteri]PAX59970.1 hypothetical protein CK510_04315 [Calothrix elsteri CCALA 953]